MTDPQAAHLIFSRVIPLLQDRKRLAHALAVLRVWLPLLYVREIEEVGTEGAEERANVHVDRIAEHLQAFAAVVAYHGRPEVRTHAAFPGFSYVFMCVRARVRVSCCRREER